MLLHRWAAYPPEPARLDELFELGYKDTFNWLRENRKIDPSGVPAGSHTSSQSVPSGSQTDSPRGSLTDSQSGSPLRSDLAGDRFFSADADNADGAHAEAEPLWRKLSCEAPSCDETFKEAFAGKQCSAGQAMICDSARGFLSAGLGHIACDV